MRKNVEIIVPHAAKYELPCLQRIHAASLTSAYRFLVFLDYNNRLWVRLESSIWKGLWAIAARFCDSRVYSPRTAHRYTDVRVGEFGAQCFHHADNTKLRCRVATQSTDREESRIRRSSDDLSPLAMSLDARQEGVNAVEHASKIDAHNPVPVVVCCLT